MIQIRHFLSMQLLVEIPAINVVFSFQMRAYIVPRCFWWWKMQTLTNTQWGVNSGQHYLAQLDSRKSPKMEWERWSHPWRATVLTTKCQSTTTTDSEALYLQLLEANRDKNIPETKHWTYSLAIHSDLVVEMLSWSDINYIIRLNGW